VDRRERFGNLLVSVKALLHQERADIWTSLPSIVQSYNPAANTVSVQPAIMAQFRQQNGANVDEKWVDVKLPVLVDCPVFFPGGGGFVATFPLKVGDEGGVLFSARCIDSWWQSGGVQKQAEIRMHDLSDGMFIPGLFSVPRVPASISTTDFQLRNVAGTAVIGINPLGQVYITAPAGVVINGNLQVTGSVTAGNGGADQVGLQTHKHPGNNTSPTAGT
jgi:hypothetical protein